MVANGKILNLEDLIMVESPYNILQDIELLEDGSVAASVINEYQPKEEGGPIGGAEFGRHVAILGSIALAIALKHNHSHYFLAVRAIIKRQHTDVYKMDKLTLKATPLKLGKRKGVIYGEMYGRNNEILNLADVEYLILEKHVFAKLYERHRKDSPVKNTFSPYIKRRSLSNILIDGSTGRAEYGTVLDHECEGHFKHFPALPVAIIGGLFGELGYSLFEHNVQDYGTIISPQTDIKAHGLIFSGEHLHFTGRIHKWISDKHIQIKAEAMVGEEIVADATFELKGIKNK